MSDLVECRDCERQVNHEGDRCKECHKEYVEFRKDSGLDAVNEIHYKQWLLEEGQL